MTKHKDTKVALLMGSSLFMEMLDSTIVTTALPQITASLKLESSSASLIISLYMLSVAIFIPLSGWLAQRYGNRTIWLTAVSLFIISSLGCALSFNLTSMLIMRVLQGISGALMVPTARLIVLENTHPKDLLKMMSYVIWPALIAPAIAPFVGGVLTTYLSWHWIFMINIPIGLILLLIGHHMLSVNERHQHVKKFDWLGFLGLSISTGTLLIALDSIAGHQKLSILSLLLLGICSVSLYMSIKHLMTVQNPLFSLSALRFSSFRLSQIGGSLLWLSVGAIPYLSTIFFQNAFHWSPMKTGTYVLLIFVGNIGIKPIANAMVLQIGYKRTLIISLLTVIITTGAISQVTPETSSIVLGILLILSGVGRSLSLTAYNGMSLVEVPYVERNSANTFASVTQNLAQGIGISLVTITFSILSIYMESIDAYRATFIALAFLSVLPLIEVLTKPNDIGMVNN